MSKLLILSDFQSLNTKLNNVFNILYLFLKFSFLISQKGIYFLPYHVSIRARFNLFPFSKRKLSLFKSLFLYELLLILQSAGNLHYFSINSIQNSMSEYVKTKPVRIKQNIFVQNSTIHSATYSIRIAVVLQIEDRKSFFILSRF